MELDDLKTAIDGYNKATADAMKSATAQISTLTDRLEELEARAATPGKAGARHDPEVRAFVEYVRDPSDSRKDALLGLQRKEMSIGSSTDGGVMVPKVIAAEIISRAIARSPLIGLVRNTNVSTSDYRRILNLRGATAAWVSETGTRSDTETPSLREIQFTHGELAAVPVATNWHIADSQFDVAAFLRENVSDVFAKSLEAAIVQGDGSNKPTGIFDTTPVATADGASPERDADAIEVIAQEGSPTDLATSIIALYFSVKPEYRAQGRWVMSSAALSKLRKLRDSDGSGFLWQPNLGVGVDAGDGMLLGKPVAISEEMANVVLSSPDAGEPVLFGDLNAGYELTTIGDLSMIVDRVTVKGKTKFYTAGRFGGRLVDNDAIKCMAVATS